MLGNIRHQAFFFLCSILLILPSISNAVSVKSYSYDEYGNLKEVIDPRGLKSHYQYDLLNRLEAIHYSDGQEVKYSYDLMDFRRSLKDQHGTTLFEPDQFGRIIKVTFPNGDTVSYRYDTEGNVTKITYPDKTEVEYAYDLSNRLKTVKDLSGTTTFEYDELSNTLKKKIFPNGVTTEYRYHQTRKISNVIHTKSDGSLIEEYRYGYDEYGNRVKIEKITPDSESYVLYTYDCHNRIIQTDYSSGFFEKFSYDGAGNRLKKTTPHATTTYEYENSENRLVKAGDTLFVYDAAGNLIKKSSPDRMASYTYDANNHLISYSDESNTISFEYDGDGNRISKTVNGVRTDYVNDLVAPTTQVLFKRVEGAWWKGEKTIRYVYGGSRISQSAGEKTHFYLYDSPGRNVSALVDLTGSVLNNYAYDTFGCLLSDEKNTLNVYQYCGEQFDEETGLIYLRNRYYDPEIGRFISKDPRPGRLDRPATLNPYCYVENNPVNFVDPLGLEAINPEEWERVRLHINDLGGWFGGQGFGGHVFLEFPDRNLFQGNYPEGMQSFDQQNINLNTTTIEHYCKRSGVDMAINSKRQMKWTWNKNCVYTAVQGMKVMGFPHAEKVKLSKITPPPSELRSQMLEFHGINPRVIAYPRERIELKHPLSSSPSMSFNFSPPGLDFGGVSLSKTAELCLSLNDVTGAAFDPTTGQLILFGPQNRSLPSIDPDDFAVAVRSIYSIGMPYPQDPGVSIDPSPIPGQLQVRYDGATRNTSFGQAMFEADRLLKCLALGKDNLTGQPLSSLVPGYNNILHRMVAEHFTGQTNIRMWFVPDQVVLAETEDHQGMVFSDARIKLLTEAEWNGSSIDQPTSRAFVQHFNAHFDEFAQEFPIFERLKTLGKITAIVKWIKDNHIPFDLSFFIDYQPRLVETVQYTPSIESQGEWTSTHTERRHLPGHRHKREVSVEHRQPIILTGGVNYTLNQRNFTTYINPMAHDFALSALRSRPSEEDFRWSFQLPAYRETLIAVAQSIYRMRKPGNVKKSYVDMSFSIPGAHALCFQRFYNSFSDKESVLGRGWRITPYEIELPLEKITISSQTGTTCTTYRAILARTPEGEHLYEPFSLDSDHCPLFRSPYNHGVLKDNLNGTFSLFIPHSGRLDFDQTGRLLSIIDSIGLKIEYHYQGEQLASICHQNGTAIFLEYDGNRLMRVSGPGNTHINYTYHSDGQLWTVSDGQGPYFYYSYDHEKHLQKITNRFERVLFEARYDDYNRAIWVQEGSMSYEASFSLEKKAMKISDNLGRESILQYDHQDRLVYQQDAQGLKWKFAYEQENLHFPTQIIDPKGGITKCRYDTIGSLTYLKNPIGAEWSFFYDSHQNLIAYQEPNGRAVVNLYDRSNRLKQTFFNATLEVDEKGFYRRFQAKEGFHIFNYDQVTGRLISIENNRRAKTTFTYHPNGEKKEVIYPTGYRVEYKVDEKGNVVEISDGFGIQKGFDYDATNRIKTIRTARGEAHLTYDNEGRLKTMLDPRGFLTAYSYDNHNLKEVFIAEEKMGAYQYNALGQLMQITLPNGACKVIEYDSLGRSTSEASGQ